MCHKVFTKNSDLTHHLASCTAIGCTPSMVVDQNLGGNMDPFLMNSDNFPDISTHSRPLPDYLSEVAFGASNASIFQGNQT